MSRQTPAAGLCRGLLVGYHSSDWANLPISGKGRVSQHETKRNSPWSSFRRLICLVFGVLTPTLRIYKNQMSYIHYITSTEQHNKILNTELRNSTGSKQTELTKHKMHACPVSLGAGKSAVCVISRWFTKYHPKFTILRLGLSSIMASAIFVSQFILVVFHNKSYFSYLLTYLLP